MTALKFLAFQPLAIHHELHSLDFSKQRLEVVDLPIVLELLELLGLGVDDFTGIRVKH